MKWTVYAKAMQKLCWLELLRVCLKGAESLVGVHTHTLDTDDASAIGLTAGFHTTVNTHFPHRTKTLGLSEHELTVLPPSLCAVHSPPYCIDVPL